MDGDMADPAVDDDGGTDDERDPRDRDASSASGPDVSADDDVPERASEIDWSLFESVRHLGVTAGASAPEVLVDDIIDAFRERFDVAVETVTTAEENIAFKLPRPLRDLPAA